MTKPFSASISFQDKTYAAMVSMQQRRNDLRCVVRDLHQDLYYILKGDRIVFSIGEGLKQPAYLPGPLAESLVSVTAEAITNHLQGEENY